MSGWMDIAIPASLMQSERTFVDQFGSIYEHSPWVARVVFEDAAKEEIATFGALAIAMMEVVAKAGEPAKLGLLRSHPELASRAALAGNLSEASKEEQSAAGLDCCSSFELAEIQQLNAHYRGKFSFPFIIAVTGLTPIDIIAAMTKRIDNSSDAELKEALLQVDRIAQIRLAALARIYQEPNA